jgi:hypothetical protein
MKRMNEVSIEKISWTVTTLRLTLKIISDSTIMVAVSSTLPNVFASAIHAIEWPLGPNSSPPLYFASLEELKGLVRKPIQAADGSPLDELVANVPEAVESWFPLDVDCDESERRHFGLISTALLLIGHGYTDECHDLVTPLSWPDDIHFAYGPSQYSQVSTAARAYATYTHCLVHRREAFNVGEFGMVGFANANFWSNAVKTSPGVDMLPHQELHASVQELAQQFGGNTQVQEWCQYHDFVPGRNDSFFESRAVHQLCATVLRDPSSNTELKTFAEKVAASEVRILLLHTLRRAGYDMDNMTKAQEEEEAKSITRSEVVVTNSRIDEDIALSAARKVSSAHLHNFETSGSIILRRVVSGLDGDSTVLSGAAGLACRLLQSPACKLSSTPPSAPQDTVKMTIPRVEDVGDLGPGDCLAAIASGIDDGSPDANSFICMLEACAADDPNALFVNRLHGSRGETPTTVVQWSKGTIF